MKYRDAIKDLKNYDSHNATSNEIKQEILKRLGESVDSCNVQDEGTS